MCWSLSVLLIVRDQWCLFRYDRVPAVPDGHVPELGESARMQMYVGYVLVFALNVCCIGHCMHASMSFPHYPCVRVCFIRLEACCVVWLIYRLCGCCQSACGPGSFNDVTGQSICKPCDAGTYSNIFNATACVQCDAGFFQVHLDETLHDYIGLLSDRITIGDTC